MLQFIVVPKSKSLNAKIGIPCGVHGLEREREKAFDGQKKDAKLSLLRRFWDGTPEHDRNLVDLVALAEELSHVSREIDEIRIASSRVVTYSSVSS